MDALQEELTLNGAQRGLFVPSQDKPGKGLQRGPKNLHDYNLSKILEIVPDAMVVVYRDGFIVFAN